MGVLDAVFLAIVGEVMKACAGLVLRLDTARAVSVVRHRWTVLKFLVCNPIGFADNALT
jgi:hypothetical protein